MGVLENKKQGERQGGLKGRRKDGMMEEGEYFPQLVRHYVTEKRNMSLYLYCKTS